MTDTNNGPHRPNATGAPKQSPFPRGSLIAQLENDRFTESEGDDLARAYRRGWNMAVRFQLAWLREGQLGLSSNLSTVAEIGSDREQSYSRGRNHAVRHIEELLALETGLAEAAPAPAIVTTEHTAPAYLPGSLYLGSLFDGAEAPPESAATEPPTEIVLNFEHGMTRVRHLPDGTRVESRFSKDCAAALARSFPPGLHTPLTDEERHGVHILAKNVLATEETQRPTLSPHWVFRFSSEVVRLHRELADVQAHSARVDAIELQHAADLLDLRQQVERLTAERAELARAMGGQP